MEEHRPPKPAGAGSIPAGVIRMRIHASTPSYPNWQEGAVSDTVECRFESCRRYCSHTPLAELGDAAGLSPAAREGVPVRLRQGVLVPPYPNRQRGPAQTRLSAGSNPAGGIRRHNTPPCPNRQRGQPEMLGSWRFESSRRYPANAWRRGSRAACGHTRPATPRASAWPTSHTGL